MTNEKRLTVQVHYDVLRAVHLRRKSGELPTLYEIERFAAVPYRRLKDRLEELNGAGFMDSDLNLTDRGYTFMQDMAKVATVLERYGYWHKG